jgi:hypothetical protein
MEEKPHWVHFTGIGDHEVGYISVAQSNRHVTFIIKRVYWVYDTPEHIERGNHAHLACKQVLIAINGTVEVELENTSGNIERFFLDNPATGLYVPVKHWRKIRLSKGAVLLCLASEEFEEQDYIRVYNVFKALTK